MSFDSLLLLGAGVLMLAIGATRLGNRLGLPALLLFLGLGMAMGSAGLGIQFNDAQLAHDLGFAALVVILAEGGLTTKWSEIRPSIGPATVLASFGVVLSIVLMALFGVFALGLPVLLAVLLGAVTAPTDSAAVFSVLRRVPLPARVRAVLEGESGLNDAPTVLLVAATTELALGHQPHGGYLGLAALVVGELIGGVLLGLLMGALGAWVLRSFSLSSSGLYAIAAVGWSVLAYGLGVLIHTSGFAAVYVCAVILGNAKLPHRTATRSFVEALGWIAQIGLFVMLGLLATPERITWSAALSGIAVGLVLTFVARPLSVVACLAPFRVPWREQAFITWAGLRGAVPIILATVPLAAGLPSSDVLFDVVLVLVIVFTLLQAPTLPWAARRLGLADEAYATDVEVEVAPMDRMRADLVQIRVPDKSRLAGVRVGELRLPRNVVVTLIIRGDEQFAPGGRDVIKRGDELLIVTPQEHRHRVEDRLREVGRNGRLARWRDGTE